MRFKLSVISVGFAVIGIGCSSAPKAALPSAHGPTSPTQIATAAPVAAAKVATNDNGLTCQRDQESRSIKIESTQPKGCRLLYPNGQTSVASSSIGNQHCENVRNRIREKLEVAGFKCANTLPTAAAATSGPKPASAKAP